MRATATLAAFAIWAIGLTAHAQAPLPPGHPPMEATPAPAPEPGEGSADEASADEAGSDENSADEAGSNENSADEAGSNENSADEAGSNENSADEAGAAPTALPPGHPAPGPSLVGPGQVAPGQARIGDVLRAPSLASAQPSADVPVGSIRVTVVDAAGQPIPDAAVDVGMLAQGDRERHNSRTDESGVAVFGSLASGGGQAYRVNVPHGGAKYSCAPFQLPPDRGYEVRITRLPVTHEDRFVFFHVFRVVVEQRGERIHVIHQAELTNAGQDTFVFPAAGQRVELPEESLNFQFQRVMTDQNITEVEDEHAYMLRGSVPPGTVRLAWAYDMELSGEELSIPIEIPLHFFGLQVIAEALPELELDAEGMPPPQRLDQQGQPCDNSVETPNCAWVTQMRRGPTDSSVDRIVLRVSGIPGPSLARWFGVGAALLLVLGGILFAMMRPRESGHDEAARASRREDLLDEVRSLEEEFVNGEIGPAFRQKRRAAIVRELAVLLHQDDAAGTSRPRRR